MLKNTKERNKGITLVALVVTIIILLILAGIIIRALSGENGLIAKVNQAKKAQIEAEMKEKLTLAISELQTEKEGKATLEDITQEWVNGKIEEYTCTVSEGITSNGKQMLMEKDKEKATFLIDENLNITLKETKTRITVTYERGLVKNGKVKLLITVTSDVNITKIELPDGDTIIVEDESKQIAGIDFEATIGEEYIFNIILENGENQEEKIRVDLAEREYLYKEGNEYTLKTGGWETSYGSGSSPSNGNAIKEDNNILIDIPQTWASYIAYTKQKIDFSNYDKAVIELYDMKKYINEWGKAYFYIGDRATETTNVVEYTSLDSEEECLELDVSSIEEERYLYMGAENGARVRIKNVWLESYKITNTEK